MGDCAWVTQALEEENVEKAIVLGKSLRRVLTKNKLVVLVRSSISLGLRDSLETTFDFVLCLDEGKCGRLLEMKMSADALVKAFAMSFSFFDRCIYLPVNSLVLKNCDELFDPEMILQESGSGVARVDEGWAEVLNFKPSQKAFKNFKAFMVSNMSYENSDSLLIKWIENQQKGKFTFVEKPYVAVIKIKDEHLLENDDHLVIGRLVDLPKNVQAIEIGKNGLSSCGLLEKFIYGYWLDIYQNEVKIPLRVTESGVINDNTNCITLPHEDENHAGSHKDPIAVIGMSCRYPSSNNLNEFWNLLIEGRDGIRTPPDHRWTKEQSLNHNPETRKTQAGFLSVPVDEFDAKFFGISPKEMIFIDPQHRILHELVWEALEDAGINPLGLNGTKTAVYNGQWRSDYSDILQRSSSAEFYRNYMGNSIGAGAARISHLLGLTGPCVATESGCSAAMVAIHMACKSLQNGESNMALACGVNLLLHPFTSDIMPMVTAPDGHSKSFDANADGFGRAEGCGVLVLKRLSEAVRDGDSIWGVIKGTAITQEGISKSMGTPTVQCESQAMQDALNDANVHPSQVSYVESHGTGTIVGDPMEITAIGKVYSEGRQEPLVIGSVKTNVGHTESCSGITGLMKVLLSMKNEVIPPHKNFKELNPKIDLEVIPAKLPLEAVKWPKVQGKPRIAGVNSFGITGTDGSLIVQEPLEHFSQRVVLKDFERPLHIMTISARTEEALDILVEKYKTVLSSETVPENVFPDVAYTTNVGRAEFNWRAAVIAKDTQEAVGVLDSNKLLRGEILEEDMSGKICFLFTGQGSQYHGMSKELNDTNPVFQMHFDNCEKILKRKYNISIAKTFWGKEENVDLVNRTLYSQTGIFVVEYCLMKLWESWGVKPDFVLGHSLGEFCAAVCAGILTFEEALTMVAERSRLIDGLPEGKMLVIKADKSTVDNLMKRFTAEKEKFWLDYAAINSPDQTVVAGDAENIFGFSDWLKQRNVKSAVLQSSHAFHSRHMDAMLQQYRHVIKNIFKKKSINPELSCAYVSGMLGKVMNSPIDWSEYWIKHTRDKVDFLNASKAVYNEGGCRVFLEIGPHPVLTAFIMMNNDGKKLICLPSLRKNETDWKTLLTSVAKLFVNGTTEIDWKRFHQFYERKKVGSILPTYPFLGTKYWPSILSSSGVQIHPILGSSIPNPTNAKLFENNLNLQNLEYLNDHVIGTSVVFPGAGYMETLLMAGHVTLDGATTEFKFPRRPIQLENFRIEAPLGLEEGIICACQTVVEYIPGNGNDTEGGIFTKFYHQMKDNEEESTKWIQHASASFSLFTSSSDPKGEVDVKDKEFYLEAINKLKATGKEENATKEFYDKVADVGLKFGPAFRTLAKVWRGTDDEKEVLAEAKIPSDASNYLVHPTLIDAMIQTTVFHGQVNQKINKKLRVPIGTQKFIWFRPLPTEETTNNKEDSDENYCYIYSSGNSKTAVLLDNDGHPVAALVQVEAIETNVKAIEALLESQTKYIPDLFKTIWKPTGGPSKNRLQFSEMVDTLAILEKEEATDRSDYSEGILEARRGIDILAFNYATLAFLNLGWSPKLNDTVELDNFLVDLGIKLQHKMLVKQFLKFLEIEGILQFNETNNSPQGSVRKLPETAENIWNASEKLVERVCQLDPAVADQVLLLQSVGQKLDKILAGTESALQVLFPDDESKPSAGKFYNSCVVKPIETIGSCWSKTWETFKNTCEQNSIPMPIIRILEVGAGVGAITQAFIETLEKFGIHYEYHYTDLSAAFFPAAEKRLEKYKKNFRFRKLNLEQDPTSQGFAPNYYDYIIGMQVVHATRDIKETLINIRQLIKDNGNVLLSEIIGGGRIYDCIFGLLEGFWRFTDHELRPDHAFMPVDKWFQAARQTGFDKQAYGYQHELGLIIYRADNGKSSTYDILSRSLNSEMQQLQAQSKVAWLIFYDDPEEEYVHQLKEKFQCIGRKALILVKLAKTESKIPSFVGGNTLRPTYEINPNSKTDMESLFSHLKQVKNNDGANGFSSIEGVIVTWGLCGSQRDQSNVAQPFLHLIQSVLQLGKKTLPQVVVLTAGQFPVGDVLCENPSSSTLLGILKCVANEHSELKIRAIDINPPEISSNAQEIFQEIFTGFNDEVGHFCSFRSGGERFIPKLVPEKVYSKVLPLPPNDDRFQLIHPKSKSIQDLEFGDLENFKLKLKEIEIKVKCSALNFKDILNILKPTEEFNDSDGVGFDFSGVVTAVGEQVSLWKIGDPVFGINLMGNALPSHIKLPEEAVVSVPDSCSFTEAACFPAVFSTAFYCLKNIANAKRGETLLIHTASGGVGLLAIQIAKYLGLEVVCTAGNQRKRAYLRSLGVQHVFHSRNTDYGEQILTATNGRGVDIVLNSLTGPKFKEATLNACAKGARFVEMSKLNIWTEEEVAEKRPDVKYTIVDLTTLDETTSRKLLAESRNLLEDGIIKPIPYTRFDAQNIREALTYLQKAHHIGKVVVTMPELWPGQSERMQMYTPLFNERSTYLITGGLGGLGMEVCKYLIEQSANNIVLVGRKPPNENTANVINNLRSKKNCNIVVLQADVGDWNQCVEMFQKMKNPENKLPPLRGIMHCAGTIADALIENAKWEDYTTTYQSKVKGSWNLHELTKDLILEHFVLFSSVTSSFGSPGQASHVSACTFEDTIAHFRIVHGLTATTINWGQFGQIGIAAEADVSGIRPFSPQQGINALDLIIRQNMTHLTVAAWEKSLAVIVKFLPYTKKYFDDQIFKNTDRGGPNSRKTLQVNSNQFWEEYNECKDEREKKIEIIQKYTKTLLRHVLRLNDDEPIDASSDLQDLGVDSLMTLELKNHIQEVLGDRVTLTQSTMKDCTTVNLMSERLVQIIEEEGEFGEVAPPTLDEIREMVLEDIKLPESIKAEVPGSEKKPSKIRTVLLTGASGSLGSHMLREVLEECPQLEKIYCLVRTRGGESAEERLRTVLERKCIMGFIKTFDKVQCISGNFIDDKLGLSETDYYLLANEVDAVIHCGAKVNHVEYYRNVTGGRNDGRSVNVGGLLKVLEFAGIGRTKHVFNASTLFKVYEVDEKDGSLAEGWPTDIAPPYNRGYLVSKYVCDFLLKKANERGIPCKSFKLAELRGSKITGRSLMDSSHIQKTFLFLMKEGIMPETPAPGNFLPIDLASRMCIRIMFNDEAPNESYNVAHPQPQLVQEYFPKLSAEFGRDVELVSWEEYRKRILEIFEKDDETSKNKRELLSEYEDLYKSEDGFMLVFSGGFKSVAKFWENSENFFRSKMLEKYVPDLYSQVESSYEIHKRDLLAAKAEGLFEKLGL